MFTAALLCLVVAANASPIREHASRSVDEKSEDDLQEKKRQFNSECT